MNNLYSTNDLQDEKINASPITFIDEADFIENSTGEGTIIRLGSGIVIGSQSVLDNSSALKIRSGDLGKSGPGPRARADANKVHQKKMNSRNSGILGVDAYLHGYDVYHNLGTKNNLTGGFEGRTSNGNLDQSSQSKKSKINNTKNSKHSTKRPKRSGAKNLGDNDKTVKAGMAQGFTLRPGRAKLKPSSTFSGLDVARSGNEPSTNVGKIEMPSRERRKMVIKVNSVHQEKTPTFSMKNLYKWMTDDDYKLGSTTRNSQDLVSKRIVKTVEKPGEVIKAKHIHRVDKESTVYLEDIEITPGIVQKHMVISDNENGNISLSSIITPEEYLNLKKTGEIDLFEFTRDPQTLVINSKAISEAASYKKATEEYGCLSGLSNERRPFNISESEKDVIAYGPNGERYQIELKKIHTNNRPIRDQVQDVRSGIIYNLEQALDPSEKHINVKELRILCDFTELPKEHLKYALEQCRDTLPSEYLPYSDLIEFAYD